MTVLDLDAYVLLYLNGLELVVLLLICSRVENEPGRSIKKKKKKEGGGGGGGWTGLKSCI